MLLFDGDCGFCRLWVARWQHRTGDRVAYEPFQNPTLRDRFPELAVEHLAEAVHLVEASGHVAQGADAVCRLLAHARVRTPLWAYAHLPGGAPIAEWAYRAVANHRPFWSRVTIILWGRTTAPSTYARASWLFLRLLGLVYLLAFWSLGTQILGLVGHEGILPAGVFMTDVEALPSPTRFWLLPTVTWWTGASDAALRTLCIAGGGLSVMLTAGLLPVVMLPALWLIYLSLSIIGGDFLSFQWDALLLETGLLAIFLAPVTLRERMRDLADPPRIAIGLLLWLLFRLMVGSGAVKLTSGDPSWRSLTALAVHFETQPIPTPLAWYAHQLPGAFLKLATIVMFGIELVAPFLMLMPRRARSLAFALLVGLQAIIALTGNYAFFNLLTASLCLFLLDDTALGAWGQVRPAVAASRMRRALLVLITIVTVPVSALAFAGALGLELPGSAAAGPLASLVAPFRSVNGYGLFAVMTTTRPEIVLEGSEDGETWLEYSFKYKVGDVHRRPPWVAPHQPRLDWQMWFAALGRFDHEEWFQRLCQRLLEGDHEVLRLFDRDPFEGRRPLYLRATLYRYRFSDSETRRREGVWWVRERLGAYSPTLSRF